MGGHSGGLLNLLELTRESAEPCATKPVLFGVAQMQHFLPFLLNLYSPDPRILAGKGVRTQPRDRWLEKGTTATATFQSTLGSPVEGSLPRHIPSSGSNIWNSLK